MTKKNDTIFKKNLIFPFPYHEPLLSITTQDQDKKILWTEHTNVNRLTTVNDSKLLFI